MSFAATWVDLEIVTLSEIRQIEKDKYMKSLTCGILESTDANEFIYKTEIDSQTLETNLWLPNWKAGGEINEELGINRYTILYGNVDKHKDLLYSTGTIFNIL